MAIGGTEIRKRFFFFPHQNLYFVCKIFVLRLFFFEPLSKTSMYQIVCRYMSLIRGNFRTRVVSMSCIRRKPNQVITSFYQTSLCEFVINGNHFQEICGLRISLHSNNNANNAYIGDFRPQLSEFQSSCLACYVVFQGFS